jgi:hypothetical protein
MSLPLRLAMMRMGMMVNPHPTDSSQVTGLAARVFNEFGDIFSEFNKTYVWPKWQTITMAKVNGSRVGLMQLFEENEVGLSYASLWT